MQEKCIITFNFNVILVFTMINWLFKKVYYKIEKLSFYVHLNLQVSTLNISENIKLIFL